MKPSYRLVVTGLVVLGLFLAWWRRWHAPMLADTSAYCELPGRPVPAHCEKGALVLLGHPQFFPQYCDMTRPFFQFAGGDKLVCYYVGYERTQR